MEHQQHFVQKNVFLQTFHLAIFVQFVQIEKSWDILPVVTSRMTLHV